MSEKTTRLKDKVTIAQYGVLASESWRETWRPFPQRWIHLPRVPYLGSFSGQRQGWKTPKRTLWQYTASVCVAGVHCWEVLWLSRSMEPLER